MGSMARQRNDSDSFTSVLRGGGAGAGIPADEHEEFAWLQPSEPAAPAHPEPSPAYGAHPGYGGYTTAVEPVPETILLRARPHARRLTLPVLILFATVTAFGYWGGRLPEEWQNWAALAAASALVLFGTLLPLFAWLGHRYTITSRRIIARHGFVMRSRQDVYLTRITDIRMRRGPAAAAFGSGDIHVAAGPDLTVVLRDVPSARLTAEFLGELTEHPAIPRL